MLTLTCGYTFMYLFIRTCKQDGVSPACKYAHERTSRTLIHMQQPRPFPAFALIPIFFHFFPFYLEKSNGLFSLELAAAGLNLVNQLIRIQRNYLSRFRLPIPLPPLHPPPPQRSESPVQRIGDDLRIRLAGIGRQAGSTARLRGGQES